MSACISSLKQWARRCIAAGLAAALSSCAPTIQPDLNSPHPQARIQAIVRAGESGDSTAIPILVDLLDDEDHAVCTYAILALEKLTRTRRGYDYADPPWRRARAVRRWRTWLDERAAGPEAVYSSVEPKDSGSGS